MEETNCEKLQCQPVADTTAEANARLLFSHCGYIQEVKLNVECQIAVLSKIVNIDFTDGIALLVALHRVKNSKFCNKYQSFFTKHLSFFIK